MLKATEEGYWFGYVAPNSRGAGNLLRNTLVIRHDGLIFASGYFGDQSDPAAADDPAPEPRDASDALTQAYVNSAIEYYMDRGLSKTSERYGNPLSWENWSYLIVADAETNVLVSSPLIYLNGSEIEALAPGIPFAEVVAQAADGERWFDSSGLNMLTGDQEEARYYIVVRDGLAFMSPRFGE